jgi:hypothetical protein
MFGVRCPKTFRAGGEVVIGHVSMEGFTMGRKTSILGLTMLVPLLLLRDEVLADERTSNPTHDSRAQHGTDAGDHGHHLLTGERGRVSRAFSIDAVDDAGL